MPGWRPRGCPGAPPPARRASVLQETGFFRSWQGSWSSDYGRFFLGWYSQALVDHARRMLGAATSVFRTKAAAKCTLCNEPAEAQPVHMPPQVGAASW